MALIDEILEQPEVLRREFSSELEEVRRIAGEIRKHDVKFVFLAARGTSDNAGLYAKYLLGAHNRIPMALAAPSLFTIYGEPPRLDGALVMGISQSGQSPDIVGVLEEGKRQGCLTLAITNDPKSPLARVADFVIDIHAGPERAVAATKTYTAQLMAVAMLSAALEDSGERFRVLERVPEMVDTVLESASEIEEMAQRYRYMEQCVVLGRGYNYATAFEWALKLKELTYVVAQPYSSADFRHGPIAIVERGFPVMAVAPRGRVFDDMMGLMRGLVEDRRAELVVVSNDEDALAMARTPLSLPYMEEWISPLVSIVPAQIFTMHLTVARGLDTEQPRGLHKVTRTK